MNNNLLEPLEWHTEQRRVRQLIPYEYNPRILTEAKKQKLRESLEKFNLAEIPAINRDDKIIAGHQRIVVLLELGRGEELVDVRVPNRMLTEQEFKEYNIRSNIGAGEWDLDILNSIFEDIDLMSLGLNVDEIALPDNLIPAHLQNEAESDFDPEPPVEPISVPGDVYELRSLQKKLTHRIICGDSTVPEVYDILLEGKKFQLILTDPPYNIDYEGGTQDKLKILNDNMSDEQFYAFLLGFYSSAFEKAEAGAAIYVFHADTEGINFRKSFKDAGFKLSQCLIWVKNSIVMGRQDYHWKHEPILYGWKEGAAHQWDSDRKQTTVLEFPRPTKSHEHPTMKPIDILVYLIKNSSKQRQIVGDCFSGSGSTIIACEQSWRQARVIELDPRFVDVGVRRWILYMKENYLQFEVFKNGKQLQPDDIDKLLVV